MTVPLPGTGWTVWPDALLRTPGFPADGLDLLTAPECAAAADDPSTVDFPAVYAATAERLTKQLREIAQDPRVLEAVAWQSPTALTGFRSYARMPADAPRNNKLREREILVTRYWQRYCGKNDTIGFFGPVCWVRLDAPAGVVTGGPGPRLLRERTVAYEWRALAGCAAALARDPELRPHLPVSRQPHHSLVGTEVRRPGAGPVAVTPAEAALLAGCDGRRTATEVAERAAAAGEVRRTADGLVLLERLAECDLVRWGIELPLGPGAEDRLRESAPAAGPSGPDGAGGLSQSDDARAGGLSRLDGARDRVAAAAGDAEAVADALAALDREYVALTGEQGRHGQGQVYAGRGLCVEDTTRDLDYAFGPELLAALAAPLDILLTAARWLTARIAAGYREGLRALHRELAAESDRPDVPLDELWYLGNGLLFGSAERPVDAATAEFVERWTGVLGLDAVPAGTRRVQLAAADLAAEVAAAFPADGPGWPSARLHSPDLHLCARDEDALRRGEFTAVLGELHAGWLTCNADVFVRRHPDPAALAAALTRDAGPRVLPLYPVDWPRHTARIADALAGTGDRWLGFTEAPVPDPDRVLPIAALTVSDVDGELVATAPDGRRWPVIELLAEFLAMFAADAYKLVASAPHRPRVTIDRLVVARESWRTTVGATGLLDPRRDEVRRYLAVRAWRAALGLPERVFVKVGTELKPCYADFTSPAYVAAFLGLLRSAGPDADLTLSELLPGPEDAWVPDAQGRRYFSELRLHAVDPTGGAR